MIDFNRTKVPCLFVEQKRYDQILKNVAGKKLAVETNLNIFYDGRDVFVDIQMHFNDMDIEENYLLYANELIEFFEQLAQTGIIAISGSDSSQSTASNILMIQLPRKTAAENALQIIKANANKNRV